MPVVRSRHGSFPEILQAAGGGLLYDPTDSQALADAIAQLMDDPLESERLAECGQEMLCESSAETVMA